MSDKEGGGGLQHRTVLLDSPNEVKPYVHQVMPNQSPEEFAALKADIREVGIEDPIWLDKERAIVDGHHRVRAWIELLAEGVDVSPVAANIYEVDDPERIYERAMKRNLNRRQLTNEQKAELVRNHLKHLAGVVYRDVLHEGEVVSWTTGRIAEFLGLTRGFVRRIRSEMEESGEIPMAHFIEDSSGRRYPRPDLQDGAQLSNDVQAKTLDGGGASAVSLSLPDGEILEANTHKELQQKLKEKLEGEEADRKAQETKLKAEYRHRIENLEESYSKELADWLETWRNPDEAPTIPNIPVEVWEKAIKRAKKNRTEKVEQVALSAAMNASELKEYEPDEVIEFVLQSDMRDMEVEQYKFAADWYGRAVEAIQSRLKRPVRAIR